MVDLKSNNKDRSKFSLPKKKKKMRNEFACRLFLTRIGIGP